MPIKPITMRMLWAYFTGALSAGVLLSALADIVFSGVALTTGIYALAAAVSVLCRWRSTATNGFGLPVIAGLSSAAITGTALATIFTPGADPIVIDGTGIYLMLGIWVLMMDVVYREIELGHFRKRWAETAGE